MENPNIVFWPECQPEFPDDADGDDDGAPTTLAPWPSPSLNARREKISRAGKPLTLIIKNWTEFIFYIKIDRKSLNSIGWAGFYSLSLIFPQFCLLHPLFPARPSIRTPGALPRHRAGCTHCGRSTLWPVTHSAWSSHSCHI